MFTVAFYVYIDARQNGVHAAVLAKPKARAWDSSVANRKMKKRKGRKRGLVCGSSYIVSHAGRRNRDWTIITRK